MEENTLGRYLKAFAGMNRATVQGIKAPHKPLLLLAILSLIQQQVIMDNQIVLSDELTDEFKRLWLRYVGDSEAKNSFQVAEGLTLDLASRYPFKCSIANPYYHLQHEPFWRLVKGDGFVERKDYTSIKALRTCFAYAEMDEELFLLMKGKESAEAIGKHLVELCRGFTPPLSFIPPGKNIDFPGKNDRFSQEK